MRHRRTLVALATALTLAALTSSCGSSGGGGGGPTAPPPGKEMDSPVISSGGTYTHRFFNAGSFPYHCAIHPVMTASVTVDAAAPAADTSKTVSIVGTGSPFFNPATIVIRPGGKIVWTNNDALAHTVTSN